MKKLILTLLVVLSVPFAQGEGPIDETRLTLRGEMLRMINRDRKQFGLQPVQLDAQASMLADEYCTTQIRNRTTGHYTIDGQAPYMRYSFAGGNDGVSENAAAWSANYRFSDAALYDMMRRSEDAMMSEVAPHDGHRRTILDPHATHVGIGLAWERGEFRLTQEFIRHYVEFTRPLPRSANAGDRVIVSAKPASGYAIEAITVHHEAAPQALSARVANAIDTYSLPDKRREYLPKASRDGSCAVSVPLSDGAGVYTVVLWVKKPGEHEAFSASNVSIRVADDASRGGTLSWSTR